MGSEDAEFRGGEDGTVKIGATRVYSEIVAIAQSFDRDQSAFSPASDAPAPIRMHKFRIKLRSR